MEKVLVTGASGFIGGFICSRLQQDGFEVFAVVRPSSNVRTLTDNGIKCIPHHFDDTDTLARFIDEYGINHFVHNAGVTRTPDSAHYYRVNTDLVAYMRDAVMKARLTPKKFLLMSSLAAYGPSDFQVSKIVSQESLPNPVTTYGKSKLKGESILQQSELPYIILRPTAVFGPREKDILQVFKLIRSGFAILPAIENQKLTFIYVQDLAEIVSLALRSPLEKRAYFVGDGNTYSQEVFHKYIGEKLNPGFRLFKLPLWTVKAYAYAGIIAGKITGNYPVLYPERIHELKAQSWECDTAPLKNDFNFIPSKSLREAIHETADWYLEHKWIK